MGVSGELEITFVQSKSPTGFSSGLKVVIAIFFTLAALFLPLSYRWNPGSFLIAAGFLLFFLNVANSLIRRTPIVPFNFAGSLFLVFLAFVLCQYTLSTLGFQAGAVPSSVYSFATRFGFVFLMNGWIFFHLLIRYVRGRRAMNTVLAAILLSAYAVSLAVFYQHFFPKGILGFPSGAVTRLQNFLAIHPNRNNVASFLELAAPVALGIGCYRLSHLFDRSGERRFGMTLQDSVMWIAFFLLILIFSAAVGTLSKFSVVALGVEMLFFIALAASGKRKRRVLWIIALFLIVGIMAAQWTVGHAIGKRFLAAKAEHYWTLDMRIPFWQRAWPLFLEFRWFGAGFGTFSSVFSSFQRVSANYFSEHLLNDYHELLIETGVAGFMIFAAAWAVFFWIQIRKVTAEKSYFRRFVGIGLLSGLFGFLCHEALISNLTDAPNAFYVILFSGLSFVVSEGEDAVNESGNRLYSGLAFLFVALSLCFFSRAYVANLFVGSHPIEMSFRRAHAVDPENAQYPFSLGMLQQKKADEVQDAARRLQRYQEAMFSVKAAMDLNPRQLLYRTAYADLALKSERYREGALAFETLSKEMPFDTELLVGETFYYFKWAAQVHDPEERGKLIRKAVEIYRQIPALNRRFADAVAKRKLATVPETIRPVLSGQLEGV